MNLDPIIYTLQKQGFVIVPGSCFQDIKTELEVRGISTEFLYNSDEKEFKDVVDFGENDPGKKFACVEHNQTPTVIKK
jgi:hypothetical protein